MKKISILVPESAVVEAVASPQYVFSAANQFLQANGKEPLFQVNLVGNKKEVKFRNGMFSVRTDLLFDDAKEADLIIIPPLFGDMRSAIALNEAAIPWIVHHYKKGTEIASLCVGAFLLASTGLLKGKKCSTHWAYYNEFRETFPDVEIVDGGVITEDNGIYSSYKVIANDLFIAIDTVRSYIKKIYEKLHVHSKSEAVNKAFKDRLQEETFNGCYL